MPAASIRGDRAAAGADGLHVHHRHVDRQAVVDGDLGGDLRHAAVDQRHVGRGAAHVVGDGVGRCPTAPGVAAAAITPEAGPDITVLAASRATSARRHRAAVAVHDQEVALEAARLQLAAQPADVAVEDRLHGRVDRRGGAALVFAELRQQRCGPSVT